MYRTNRYSPHEGSGVRYPIGGPVCFDTASPVDNQMQLPFSERKNEQECYEKTRVESADGLPAKIDNAKTTQNAKSFSHSH